VPLRIKKDISNTMKVVICWTHISGYMSACWRELAKKPGVSLYVVAWQSGAIAEFQESIMSGIPSILLPEQDQNDFTCISENVLREKPDIIVLCGWMNSAYRALTVHHDLRDKKFVMTMDNPWLGKCRQYIAHIMLHSFLKRMSNVVVTGERSWQYANRLGIPENKIRRGTYGVDVTSLHKAWQERKKAKWPGSFLFTGRYEKGKAVDILVMAYKLYRQAMSDESWPLICCGSGPLAFLLEKCPGVHDRGFVQPAEMVQIRQDAGLFLMPSRIDPWPLAIVEACAAGLPVIATEECGSTVECVRHLYNGYLIPSGDADALAEAMLKAHHNYKRLPEMGMRSLELAYPYSAEMWAERWLDLLKE
jgi:glycosyltransferase involved in cell wall biosynthesis